VFPRTWTRRLLRISAALATAALLVPATAGTAVANVGAITVTSGPTPNPVVRGGSVSYNLTVENRPSWADPGDSRGFMVTGVSGASGLSVAWSPCVSVAANATGTLNGVVIQTSASTPLGTGLITLTVTEYWLTNCDDNFGTWGDPGTRTATLVVKAAQTITFAALGGKTYGGAPFAVSATASSNLPVTFGVTGHCSSVGSTVTITGVGDCSITASQAGDATRLPAADVTRTFAIAPAVLDVTASHKNKIYGADNPTLTVGFTGFVYGESYEVVSGNADVTTTATTASPVGDYPITPSAHSLSADNYTFTYGPGTLTVHPAPLSLQADSLTKVQGEVNPALTWTFDGFVNSDTAAVLTFQPTCLTTALTSSQIGDYTILCTGATAANYTVSHLPGNLAVVAGSLHHIVISPDPATIAAGATQAYTTEGFDVNDNSLGNATAATVFAISGGGSCTGAVCGSGVAGDYTVTATTSIPGVGRWTDTAILHVTAAAPTVAPTEVVGGETATPSRNATLPPTSTNGSTTSDGSLPLLVLLIALAFSALGLLAVQVQRREVRR